MSENKINIIHATLEEQLLIAEEDLEMELRLVKYNEEELERLEESVNEKETLIQGLKISISNNFPEDPKDSTLLRDTGDDIPRVASDNHIRAVREKSEEIKKLRKEALRR